MNWGLTTRSICGSLAGGLMLLSSGAVWGQTSPSDFTSATRYDAANRLVGTIAPDPDGSGPIHYAATRTSYDAAGRVTKVETGELASWQSESVLPSSWESFTTFTVFSQVESSYDAMGRKLTEKLSSGSTAYSLTQFSYDSNGRLECTAVRMNRAVYSSLPTSACTLSAVGSDGPDRITKTVYDVAGQPLRTIKAYGQTAANGLDPLQQDYVTYTFSDNGKVATIKDANGNLARYTYDGFDRQVQWNFPDKVTAGAVSATDYEAYTFDANGNRLTLRKRDGSVIAYTYDALNRVTIKDIPGGTSADVYYGYDARGLETFARFASTGGVGLTNVYDGFGRLTSASNNMSGTALTISYQWDADGNRIRVTHPDTTYFTFDYDGLDRQTTVKESGATTVAMVTYDNQGRRSGDTRSGVASTYGYDAISRPTSLADDLSGTTYDVTTTFAYNPASQIVTKVRSNDAYAFTGYVSVSRNYVVNGLNQYTTGGPASYTYDANGNLTGDGTNTYSYDVENRLLTRSGGLALAYDPNGRLWQSSGGASGTTRFLYDGDELLAEYDGFGSLQRRYVHGPEEDDPILWYEGLGLTDRRSLQIDQQGSIVSIANATGMRLAIDSYDEYGIPGIANIGRFQYTGQAWLPDLGMYYYKARIYSPTLGRFLQTDPIGYKDQVNLYAYVGNDPTNKRDPTGKDSDCVNRGTCVDSGPITWKKVGVALASLGSMFIPTAAPAIILAGTSNAVTISEAAAFLAEGLAPGAGVGATTGAGVVGGLYLAKSLASEAQLAEIAAGRGAVVAGRGSATGRSVDDVGRLVSQFGGKASDWQKVSSSASKVFKDGTRFEIHAYRDAVTGLVVNPKTVLIPTKIKPRQ